MRLLPFLLPVAFFVLLSPAAVGTEESSDKPAATQATAMRKVHWRVAINFFSENNDAPLDAEASLKNMRVSFPERSYARYDKTTKELTVVNTPEQLMAVDAAILDYRGQTAIGQKSWKLSRSSIQELSKDGKDLKKDTLECIRELGHPIISAKLKKGTLQVQAALEELQKLSNILESDKIGAIPGKTKQLGYLKARAYWQKIDKKNTYDESAPVPAPDEQDFMSFESDEELNKEPHKPKKHKKKSKQRTGRG